MKKKLNIAVVGLGCRGRDMLKLILEMKDIRVVGVSDIYQDRVDAAVQMVTEAGQKAPLGVTDYRRLLEIRNLDAVYTPSSWTSHVQICLDCMEAGIYVGTEVGGVTSIRQCWKLVETSERTGIPCMLMENCCFGREEMLILNMVKQNIFGECIHAEGGYRHDLRNEVCMGEINRHYRRENYMHRGGDVYPTHALGPLAKILQINRGNRMLSLTSMASKSRGLEEWMKIHMKDSAIPRFLLGDVITTTIKCAQGETITLFHDTSLPRPYSRACVLQGTKGLWQEDRNGIYLDGISENHWWEPLEKYYEKYEHPLWKWFMEKGVTGGHGGMDYLVLRAFFEAAGNHTQTPIDVYDTATWMSITTLSEDSCNMGGQPVAIPDFTDGGWMNRKDLIRNRYSLDVIPEDVYFQGQ